jgi:hypothetical protein
MVSSIESLINLPGAPEHMTPYFRQVMDAAMQNPGCNYCHSPETMEYLRRLMKPFEHQDQERNKLTVGELLDSIDGIPNLNITTEELMKVAEIGKLLFYAAICQADEDNAVIKVIHSTVPEELWPEILRKIDGPVAADTPADEIEDGDEAEDEYDPVESVQADEDGWTQRAGRDLTTHPTDQRACPDGPHFRWTLWKQLLHSPRA